MKLLFNESFKSAEPVEKRLVATPILGEKTLITMDFWGYLNFHATDIEDLNLVKNDLDA